MFRGVPQDVYRLVFKGRASACDRTDGVQNYRHELYSRCVLADDTHVFQAIGRSVPSIALSLIRQVLGLMPLFYAFSFIGLDYTWIAFPVSETMTTIVGLILYVDQLKSGSVKSGLKRNERVRQRKIASVRAKSKRRATNRHSARKRIKCTIIHTNVSLYNYCLTF